YSSRDPLESRTCSFGRHHQFLCHLQLECKTIDWSLGCGPEQYEHCVQGHVRFVLPYVAREQCEQSRQSGYGACDRHHSDEWSPDRCDCDHLYHDHALGKSTSARAGLSTDDHSQVSANVTYRV